MTKSSKKKNNGVNAPSAYWASRLDGDFEVSAERKLQAFEDSVVRQYCQAINFDKKKMVAAQDEDRFLTFDSLNFWPNDIKPTLRANSAVKYEDLARWTYKQVERAYLKLDEELYILNDNTFKANRGCAIFKTNDLTHLHGIEGEVLVKRGPYNNCLIIGEPYNIFRLLVNINLIAEYEASEEDDS